MLCLLCNVLCLQNCEPSYKFPFLVNSLLIRTDIQPVCTKVLGHQFIIPTGAGHAMKLPAHTVFFADVNAEKVCNSVVTESEKC